MTHKIKILLVFLISFISFCIFSSSYNIFAQDTQNDYLICGFSGGFYLIKNNNNTASCTSIKSNGESTEVFHQTEAKIIKTVTSRSYLYLVVEDKSTTESFISVFTLLRNGLITSVYSIDPNLEISTFTADDNYFYFCCSKKDTILKINQSRKSSEEIVLQRNIKNLFNYNDSIFALTDNSIINLINTNKTVNSDIPYFSDSNVFRFYNNICIDDNGKVYSFDENIGFRYMKSVSYEKCFILDNTYCGVTKNIIYSLSENGSKIGKYTCNSNISDICVSENKVAILYSGNIKIISLKDFTPVKSENSRSEEISLPNKNNSDTNNLNEYEIVDNYIIVPEETTVSTLKKHINTANSTILVFCNANGKTITSGKIGTGFSVAYYNNSTLQKKYTIIIMGDITGEGSVNTRDSKILTDYLLEKCDLNEIQKFSADLDNNKNIDSIDLLLLIRLYK